MTVLDKNEYECGVVDASEIMEYKPTPKLPEPFRLGKHLYAQCQYCNKYVRLTGFLARGHFCNDSNPRVREARNR